LYQNIENYLVNFGLYGIVFAPRLTFEKLLIHYDCNCIAPYIPDAVGAQPADLISNMTVDRTSNMRAVMMDSGA
jgi:hypothetical protein